MSRGLGAKSLARITKIAILAIGLAVAGRAADTAGPLFKPIQSVSGRTLDIAHSAAVPSGAARNFS